MFVSNLIKLTITSVNLIFPVSSFAEWIYITKLESGNLYLDSKSVHRFDDVVEAIILQNLIEKEEGSKSIISDIKYDCKRKLMTVMTIQRFPLDYAKGKILSFDAYMDGNWKINTPVSPTSILFLNVCGKYKQLPNNK